MSIEIVDAHSQFHVPVIRALLVEYSEALGIDLCYQNFDEELAQLPGKYAPPFGGLLLARCDGLPAGCIALRKLNEQVGEIKRLWVRPHYRGRGIGRRLLIRILDVARDANYRLVQLDTLPTMTAAVSLYRSLGFQETAPYTHNPIPDVMFMGKWLDQASDRSDK